jgi:hypothetical protein
MNPAERYRQNADDCRQRSLQARTAADKANWLRVDLFGLPTSQPSITPLSWMSVTKVRYFPLDSLQQGHRFGAFRRKYDEEVLAAARAQ